MGKIKSNPHPPPPSSNTSQALDQVLLRKKTCYIISYWVNWIVVWNPEYLQGVHAKRETMFRPRIWRTLYITALTTLLYEDLGAVVVPKIIKLFLSSVLLLLLFFRGIDCCELNTNARFRMDPVFTSPLGVRMKSCCFPHIFYWPFLITINTFSSRVSNKSSTPRHESLPRSLRRSLQRFTSSRG